MKPSLFTFGMTLLGAASFFTTAQAAILSGHVTDGVNPVFDANVNVFDSATGTQIATTLDHTDVSGNFAFTVPTGTIDVHVIPQFADRLAGLEIKAVVVPGDLNMGTLIVQHGFVLSGTIHDSGGFPVDAVDIDAIRTSDGVKLYTPGDNSDLSGFVDVIVPPGTYDIAIDPPQSTFLVGRVLPGITISGDTSFGIVNLDNGFQITGRVAGPGNASVVGADMDARDTFTGASIRLVGDNTDGLGNFSIILPQGSFDIDTQPTVGSRLVPARVLKVDVVSDANIGTINVVAGFNVTGTVTAAGSPVSRINLDAYSSNDAGVPIQGDVTDATGVYSTIVPSGSDDLYVDVLSPSGFKHVFLENLSITGDRTQDFALQTSNVTCDIVPADVGTTVGGFIHYSINLRNNTGSARTVNYTVVGKAFNNSIVRTLVPQTSRSLPAGPGTTTVGPLQSHVPGNLRPRFLRVPVRVFVTVTDPGTGAVLDTDFYEFRVY